jgi:hypothetical protein
MIQCRIEFAQSRLDDHHALVKTPQPTVFDRFEQKMRIPRLATRGDIRPLGSIAPGECQVTVPHNAAVTASELAQFCELLVVKLKCFWRDLFPGGCWKDVRLFLSACTMT